MIVHPCLLMLGVAIVSSTLAVKCKPYDPPINGLISCAYWDGLGGELCTLQCNSTKEFARVPGMLYICLTSGNWLVWDVRPTVSREMPWPDCTEEYVPKAARKGMDRQYFVGNCSNPAVQQLAKQNFINGINEDFGGGDPQFCEKEQFCKLDNIVITCGKTQK